MAWILVIDDESYYRGVIRRILESRGHRVIEASDGAEGLEAFNEHQPDIVITDMIMAGLSGEEVIRAIRQTGLPVGIIAVSGDCAFYNVDSLQLAQRLGADAILRKLDPMQRILTEVDLVLAKPAYAAAG
jgi:CheY-like chemotaxis protein